MSLQFEKDYVEYRKYTLDEIVDWKLDGREFEATFGRGNGTEVREIRFAKDVEAQAFHAQLASLRRVAEERAAERLAAFRARQEEIAKKTTEIKSRADPSLNLDEDIQLLVEIVSCSALPIADARSTDPYVTVYLGKDEVHRTKTISKT